MAIRAEIREEADYIRLQGGEMPEVVMHESLNQLASQDMVPSEQETTVLRQAVLDRYLAAILRDLNPDNRCQSFFRGPERAKVNWNRAVRFAEKSGLDPSPVRKAAAQHLKFFLEKEFKALDQGRTFTTLGLSVKDLVAFAQDLNIMDDTVQGWIEVCGSVRTLDFRATIKAGRDGLL